MKLPYYQSLAKAVKANIQAGRGGACTAYYACFDPQAVTIAQLQNPRQTEDIRNRDIHFAMLTNRLLARKAAKNEEVFSFTIKSAPDLMALLFSGDQDGFEALYNQYDKDPAFTKTYSSAAALVVLIMQQGHEVATNYLAFIDEINRHTSFKEPIHSSNLCVAPETLLLTDKGHIPIASLVNQPVTVWNGKQWSATTVVKTGENQKLLHVVMQSGEQGDFTPYHKFYLTEQVSGLVKEVRASELKSGDQLCEFFLPVAQFGSHSAFGGVKSLIVKEVIDDGRIDDTYCVNEPLEHKAVFNGILTGNCMEITEPTSAYYDMLDLYTAADHGRGEVAICSLAALVPDAIHSDAQYESAAYYALKMIDKCIHISDYPLAHVGFTAKQRLNAAVGIVGQATCLARKGLKYSEKSGKEEIHRIAERHAYFVISASLKLGQELGNAPWMHKTKWPEGWLPIDTYKKTLDAVVSTPLAYDWEALRQAIVANKGIRNSCVIAHMPTESSSKASGRPKGLYPITDLAEKKSDSSNVIDWCAIDDDLIGQHYELAFDIPTLDMIECYAITQKFTDQAISADLFENRVKSPTLSNKKMITEFIHMVKFGLKTRYYQKSKIGADVTKTQEVCASGSCDV
jgi:ribonucleotide reductase alpha subunit